MVRIRQIRAKSILSRSKVYEYTLNPYVGCEHGCVYCYARFMKRFTGHREGWGGFVDVKINAPELLAAEIRRKKVGRVWMSGVCDPYQPVEETYGLTRRCLEILLGNGWPVTVQTKSPLVLRDLDLLKGSETVEVGFTITTADERIREIFEPGAPAVEERLRALSRLRSEGVETFVMIAPLLPGAGDLVQRLKGRVEYVLIDRMNYHYADRVYRRHALEWAMGDAFFRGTAERLKRAFQKEGIPCQVLF